MAEATTGKKKNVDKKKPKRTHTARRARFRRSAPLNRASSSSFPFSQFFERLQFKRRRIVFIRPFEGVACKPERKFGA